MRIKMVLFSISITKFVTVNPRHMRLTHSQMLKKCISVSMWPIVIRLQVS